MNEVQKNTSPAVVNPYVVTFLLTLSGIVVPAAILFRSWAPGPPHGACWLFCKSGSLK